MLLTFLRSQIGTDETVFLRYLLSEQVPFVNIDDTTFANFYASSLFGRLARRAVRNFTMDDMAAHVSHVCYRYGVDRVFIFNGRGINQRLIDSMPKGIPIVWLNPDFKRHAEHVHIENAATTILFTKPSSFNSVRFPNPEIRKKVRNITPVLFATRNEKAGEADGGLWTGLEDRDIPNIFLGNHSPFKSAMLEELSSLTGQEVTVIGAGWKKSPGIVPLGPIYGHAVSKILGRSKVAIALPDVANGELDPITVRYFQYPLLGTPAVFYVNDYNRFLLGELSEFCFENLPEAVLRIRRLTSLSPAKYREACSKQAEFVNKTAVSAEEIMRGNGLV